MRIAVVEPSGHGGLLHYSGQLAAALAARGHAVDLIAAAENELEGRLQHARMRAVLAKPVGPGAAPRSRVAYHRRRVGVAVRLLRAWARIGWETRPGRYDAILHGADIGITLAALATLAMTTLPRRAVFARIAHNVRTFNRWGGQALYAASPLREALLRRVYRRFDLILVHGDRSRAEFEETWGPARVALVPHGDERIFGEPPPPSDEERILFFGDWRKVKGLPVLMDAFDELARRRPSVRLTVAGTPALEDWDPDVLRRWARAHDGRVELIDRYVPMADVASTFARARVVVTPYVAGYQSGVIHLAATMGRAVVTSDVGDLPGAVQDGVTGRVVPAGDPARLADALEEIVSDASLAARMGHAARESMLAGSSWELVAQRVEAELEALVVGARTAR